MILETVVVGAKQFFSWKMLWLLILTALIASSHKYIAEILCNNFPQYCFWIEKLVFLSGVLLSAFFVFVPFSKLFGLNEPRKK